MVNELKLGYKYIEPEGEVVTINDKPYPILACPIYKSFINVASDKLKRDFVILVKNYELFSRQEVINFAWADFKLQPQICACLNKILHIPEVCLEHCPYDRLYNTQTKNIIFNDEQVLFV